MGYAKQAFAEKIVRRLTIQDVKRFTGLMRDAGASDSTRAKHLRVLVACLNSAIAHGYAARNVASELPKGERPRARKRESAYFTNAELPQLFAQLEDAGVFRVLFLVALKTGMRLGELSALKWGDVDLIEGVIRVRLELHRRPARPAEEPRDPRRRPGARCRRAARRMVGRVRPAEDDRLCLPRRDEDRLRERAERAALVALPGDGRDGDERRREGRRDPAWVRPGRKRTFHSFRHTFAKRALESGRPITWLSRHLGHSSLAVTSEVYGHWERAERKREAQAMAGVFGV